MSARNRELVGLLPAALLVTAGFTAVFISEGVRELDNVSLVFGAYFLAVCIGVHAFLRIAVREADPYLFPLVAVLAAVGLVMLYRIDPELARDQATWFVVGLAAMAAVVIVLHDYHVLQRYRYVIVTAGLALLLTPRLPGIGEEVNGAFIQVSIGSFTFQPAEISKLCVVIFLASYLYEKREVLVVGARRVLGLTLPPLRHFGPLLAVWGAAMGVLVLLNEFGMSLMYFGAFLALLYIATARLSFIVAGLGLFAAGAWAVAETASHVRPRFETWLDPLRDPEGAGYQVSQSFFAQADGGLFGRGLGESLLDVPGGGRILPEAQNDLIYAVIVNEIGLFGAAAVLAVYLLIVQRGLKIAMVAPDGFSKLLAAGLTTIFALQVFVIVGGVTGAIPLTGVTLPFLSSGGSSIVANMALIGLLLLISDRGRRLLAREPGEALA